MKPFRILLIAVLIASLGAWGCGGDDSGPVSITGALQKGPLLQGSSLTVAMLTSSGAPRGTNYNTTTSSDLGDFSVTAQTTGPAELVGEGFYFNEIINGLSGAPITLRALYEVVGSGEQHAYLNVFTHMSSGLALKLLTEGSGVTEAVAEAENKLFEALGILHPEGALQANGTSMDLMGSDSPDNQYIMAVSCIVAKAAELRALTPNEVDARLQELLNDIRSQLQNSETITPTYKQYLRDAESSFNPMAECTQNLADYLYDKTGVAHDLPDPNTCADMDGDGVPNASDPDIDGDGVLNVDDCDPWDQNLLGFTYLDETTGLMWQNCWEDELYLSWQEAMDYCDDLDLDGYTDWRLPDIDELISLLRGCVDGTPTGDLSPSACVMTPAGCAATDSCGGVSSCTHCWWNSGPGADGCYWDPALVGTCSTYWSSSSHVPYTSDTWTVSFHSGCVCSYDDKVFDFFYARCVRGGP